MEQKSASPLWLHDIAAALGLLTRIPVAIDPEIAQARSAISTWAYPVVGFVLGGLSLLVILIGALLGLPPVVGIVFVIGFNVVVTGAMHQDGLADAADGLWGGWTIERRLAIMKDSHIGVYGVCAVVLSLLLHVVTLSALALHPLMALAFFGGASLSRAMMVAVMHYLPNARGGGLSQSVGRPTSKSMWIGLGIASAGTLLIGLLIGHGGAAFLMIAIAGAAALVCAVIARRKIGGQTGDILGATQQVSELAMLVTLSALIY